jgi:hypothetical protein
MRRTGRVRKARCFCLGCSPHMPCGSEEGTCWIRIWLKVLSFSSGRLSRGVGHVCRNTWADDAMLQPNCLSYYYYYFLIFFVFHVF